jgi:tripartite-type tricarboxylate transporter receptor subunit TctC
MLNHRKISIAKAVTHVAAAAAIVGGASLTLAPQSTAADFYKGKTFTVMVASRAGGGTDTTARLVARSCAGPRRSVTIS